MFFLFVLLRVFNLLNTEAQLSKFTISKCTTTVTYNF